MLELRLPPDIEKRLDELARRTGRSKIDYVTEAIVEHLGDLEDADLARARVDDIPAGKEKTISLCPHDATWHGRLKSAKRPAANSASSDAPKRNVFGHRRDVYR